MSKISRLSLFLPHLPLPSMIMAMVKFVHKLRISFPFQPISCLSFQYYHLYSFEYLFQNFVFHLRLFLSFNNLLILSFDSLLTLRIETLAFSPRLFKLLTNSILLSSVNCGICILIICPST